ncbi:zf-HC2 domain-containing protein [Streptomyces sp. NPDC059740]|uniref:anti-sigma factor family protein n=1 Tax=Streptomyces sp. NPDC059740 TaxID=3346926 RepID=UPI0036629C43
MSGKGGPSPAEHHLGDRLAALVDGELGHDARERVLAHLATCHRCKAEADAQRRLKSVFAASAPPGPSAGLLARLQNLPGGDGFGPRPLDGAAHDPTGPDGRPDPDSPAPRDGRFGTSQARSRLGGGGLLGSGGRLPSAALLPDTPPTALGAVAPSLPPRSTAGTTGRRPETLRTAAQRRRFAFTAASAFSLAALALGGAVSPDAGADPGSGADSAVTPLSATPDRAEDRPSRDRQLLAVQDRVHTSGATAAAPSAPKGGQAPPSRPAASPSPSGYAWTAFGGPRRTLPPRTSPLRDAAGLPQLSPPYAGLLPTGQAGTATAAPEPARSFGSWPGGAVTGSATTAGDPAASSFPSGSLPGPWRTAAPAGD